MGVDTVETDWGVLRGVGLRCIELGGVTWGCRFVGTDYRHSDRPKAKQNHSNRQTTATKPLQLLMGRRNKKVCDYSRVKCRVTLLLATVLVLLLVQNVILTAAVYGFTGGTGYFWQVDNPLMKQMPLWWGFHSNVTKSLSGRWRARYIREVETSISSKRFFLRVLNGLKKTKKKKNTAGDSPPPLGLQRFL